MITLTPFLKLNRLIIYTLEGKLAYDEFFHSGVNIVRGNNSSGKSTILNFIYYVLGGDLRKWTESAEECAVVYAEVELNGAKVTLKRQVDSTKSMQPMGIYWGEYEKAKQSEGANWEMYGYKRSAEKKSFSNALFVALGFPELKGDVDNNITMHQILRLMYSDQRSLTQDLLMTENFDSTITRQTIGDLMFGIYDDLLYAQKLQLREDEKEYDVDKQQIGGIKKIYQASGNKIDVKSIEKEINDKINQLNKVNETLSQNQASADENFVIHTADNNTKRQELFELRKELERLQESIVNFEYDIADSREFISSLERRMDALNEALLTREALSNAELVYCPHCLSPIDKHHVEPDTCFLCKQKLPEDYLKSQIKRMQQEIDNQIRESKLLLNKKEKILLEQVTKLPVVKQQIWNLQQEIQESISSIRSTTEVNREELYVKKGELKADINSLTKQLGALDQIAALEARVEQLELRIGKLKKEIASKEMLQATRLIDVQKRVSKIAHEILDSDLGRQEDFKQDRKVEFSFRSNTFSYGGKNNFSESSVVFLKNSILFAIFFTSLELTYFRYPRFFLCDNTEDKGMEEERSKSFQRKIVEISNSYQVDHQIILSTSKIAPELNNELYCIGEYYTAKNHSLKNVKI